ncbi:MAG: hypothetical protein QM788_09915 [Roseateles sp.]|uniref:hypothetical protein n=1 Tax=Roseateles sp. TaxID=1971397 RepID=UPI0039E86104
MRPPRAVLLSALLALACHTALLWPAAGPARPAVAVGAAAGPLRLSLLRPAPPHAEPAAPAAATPAASVPAPGHDVGELARPDFVGGSPEVGFPDALLPDAGVQLRAYVRVAADGQVSEVLTATRPADAPSPFQGLGERALAGARFAPAPAARAHCLQLDFRPGAAAPRWAWRRDATAERCLRSAARTARALPAPG